MTDDTLASWRDGPAKRGIVDFVRSASEAGSGFVAVADRIATFDNDGTLWVEQPMPPQFDFVFRKWAQEVEADPSLAREQPYQAIIEKDEAFFEGIATQDPKVAATLLAAFVRSWAGTTPEQFDEEVRAWLTTVNQPKFGVPYVKLVYQPTLELLDLLKANDWRVFVCSGGGRDFMRVFAEETWGIYKERVIGSAAAYTYADADADAKIVRSEQLLGSLDLGLGKPEHIFAQTGRLLAFAGVIVSAALALALGTYRTVQLFDWQQTAKRIGTQWAKGHGGRLLAVRFDGSTLVFVVQGRAGGDEDPQLLTLLHGHLPNGTPIDVDRLDAGLRHVGDVGDH